MSVLTSIKRVANNGLQAELLDVVEKGTVNVLAVLNKGDERFKVGSERRAWFPITTTSLAEELRVNPLIVAQVEELKEGEVIELNIENPKIQGMLLRIQVTESIIPDVWQRQNTMKAAKQMMITEDLAKKAKVPTEYNLTSYVNKNGYFMNEDGNFIFARTSVTVEGQVNHTFIQGKLVPETELGNYGATLAENVSTAQHEEVNS